MDIQRSNKEFPYVQKYKDLAQQLGDKDYQEQECPDYFLYPDQEVPQLRSSPPDEWDTQMEIKLEANSPLNQSDSIFVDNSETFHNDITNKLPTFLTSQTAYEAHNDFTYISTNNENSLSPHFSVTNSNEHFLSNASPLLSSTALPSYSSFSKNESRSHNDNIIKAKCFVSEAAGSGCTVLTKSSKSNSMPEIISNSQHFFNKDISNSNSFTDDMTPPSMSQSIDFLDLDKHQDDLSFYDDVKPFTNIDDELMNMVKICDDMKSTLHHDCRTLNISHDPNMWNCENVHIWVAQICKSKGFPPPKYHPIDGRMVCDFQEHQFNELYGHTLGDIIFKELQLLQAANACGGPTLAPQQPSLQNYEIKDSQFNFSDFLESPHPPHPTDPCVMQSSLPMTVDRLSPALSSSSSQDMDNTEDSETDHPSIPQVAEGVNKTSRRGHKQTIHLWQFLRELLITKDSKETCIRWVNREAGIFKIEDSKRVAFLWGNRKNRPAMNYDKLSRSVRQYYKKGIIKKTEQSKRLVYQFCAGYL